MESRKRGLLAGLFLALTPMIAPLADQRSGREPRGGPMPDRERLRELQRTQEYQLRMHELMHRILEAPNEAERERLKAEQLQLMEMQVNPHAPPPAPAVQ